MHCTADRLSESFILVEEGSVQLVLTSLALRLLNTHAVTLVFATTPSPFDASLVPSLNRHIVA